MSLTFIISKDPNARRHLYNNAKRLVTVTKGKNIIFSSEALNALEIRSQHDLIAFGVSIGLNQAKAKECITENCRRVLKRSGKMPSESMGFPCASTYAEYQCLQRREDLLIKLSSASHQMPQQKLQKNAKVILMVHRMGNLRKRNEMVQIFLFARFLQALNLLNANTTLNKLVQPASAFFEVVVYTSLKSTSNYWTAGALIFWLLSILVVVLLWYHMKDLCWSFPIGVFLSGRNYVYIALCSIRPLLLVLYSSISSSSQVAVFKS